MDQNAQRIEINKRIAELAAARDAATTEAAKAEILAQIKATERLLDLIDIGAADQLGARIDAILTELEEIQTRHPLDALASLGRAAENLRQLRTQV
jgi:hypothetical protein